LEKRSQLSIVHVFDVRPRKDKRGVDLISDVAAIPGGCGTAGHKRNQQRNRLCAIAPLGFGFRVCSPYRHGRDCGTPKPGKKKQKRYGYACAVLVIHRFPFSLLLTRVVRKIRLEVTPKA
jgi:hypothetical protein